MKQLGDKINEFLEVELKAHPQQVDQFFTRVQTNYDEAIRTATRFLLLMIATWFLTYAIHEEWIKEIQWAGIKFERKMTVAAPFIVGLLSYGLQSALGGAVVLWEAISRRLRYTLPTAWKHNLDDLLAPPTFSNVERLLEPEIEFEKFSLCSRGWFILITVLIFGGSVAGLVHTTYLLIRPSPAAHWVVIAISATLGAVAWVRGVVLSAYAIEVTGGFQLCHHRGTRTMQTPDEELPQGSPQDSPQDGSSVSPAPSLQQQPSTIYRGVAPAFSYRQARLFEVRRAGALILVERKKRRGSLNVRL
jgi:hypothetical protein